MFSFVDTVELTIYRFVRLMDYLSQAPQSSQNRLTAFYVSCWVMGLLAFFQLVSIGTAMAFRSNTPVKPEVVTKIETRYVEVEKPVLVEAPTNQLVGLTPEEAVAEAIALIEAKKPQNTAEPRVLQSAPLIADPVVERLLKEARAARIAGDFVKSTIKLEEAQVVEGDNPNVLYEMAVNFESLGTYDSAADYFLKVYELGPLVAGSLFKKAALKLERGVVPEMTELAALNGVRALEPMVDASGERRSVNLAITVAPEREFDPTLIHVQVHFFEESNGDIRKAPIDSSDPLATGSQCASMPYDWRDGEEIIEVWYHLPVRDRADQEIFGERKFHGFVAELYYDGTLLDIRAQPRTLVQQIRAQKSAGAIDAWDPNLDPILEALESQGAGSTLLPKLPRE